MSYRLSSVFFIEAFLLSILSFVSNAILGVSMVGIVVQFIVNLAFLAVFLMPLKLRQKIMSHFLLVLIFAYIPFMYFQFGGYDGSVLFFAVIAAFSLVFLYKGKIRLLLVMVNILIYVVAILIQFHFPEAVLPMAGQDERIADIVLGLVFTIGGAFILGWYVGEAYEGERLRNVYLLNEVESKNNELQELSIRDGLTGVYNRRYLTEASRQILERTTKDGLTTCAIMFDIDHFKRVNDTYGHHVGDKVLNQVVQAAKLQLRKNDVFARYGGEEFVIILYPETRDNALRIAERIRVAVERLSFEEEGLSVAVSIGVTESSPEDTLDSFLRKVDESLYLAKNKGRNRVESR